MIISKSSRILATSFRFFGVKPSPASSGQEKQEKSFSEKFNQLFDKFKQTP